MSAFSKTRCPCNANTNQLTGTSLIHEAAIGSTYLHSQGQARLSFLAMSQWKILTIKTIPFEWLEQIRWFSCHRQLIRSEVFLTGLLEVTQACCDYCVTLFLCVVIVSCAGRQGRHSSMHYVGRFTNKCTNLKTNTHNQSQCHVAET